MDKKLSRQILYVKPETEQQSRKKEKQPEAKKTASEPHASENIDFSKESDNIKVWFKAHPLFKPSSLCKEIGLDKGNFSKILNSDAEIPQKYIMAIIKILKGYGYF